MTYNFNMSNWSKSWAAQNMLTKVVGFPDDRRFKELGTQQNILTNWLLKHAASKPIKGEVEGSMFIVATLLDELSPKIKLRGKTGGAILADLISALTHSLVILYWIAKAEGFSFDTESTTSPDLRELSRLVDVKLKKKVDDAFGSLKYLAEKYHIAAEATDSVQNTAQLSPAEAKKTANALWLQILIDLDDIENGALDDLFVKIRSEALRKSLSGLNMRFLSLVFDSNSPNDNVESLDKTFRNAEKKYGSEFINKLITLLSYASWVGILAYFHTLDERITKEFKLKSKDLELYLSQKLYDYFRINDDKTEILTAYQWEVLANIIEEAHGVLDNEDLSSLSKAQIKLFKTMEDKMIVAGFIGLMLQEAYDENQQKI